MVNLDIAGKTTLDVGLLKNENRASELKPTSFKGQIFKKLTQTNTCAFDSFVWILACYYHHTIDQSLKEHFEFDKSQNKILDFAKELASKPITPAMYWKRLKLLLDYN